MNLDDMEAFVNAAEMEAAGGDEDEDEGEDEEEAIGDAGMLTAEKLRGQHNGCQMCMYAGLPSCKTLFC